MPLAGSILTTNRALINSDQQFVKTSTFEASKIANVGSDFTYQAFAWNFLNASMPEMMTETFAIDPVEPGDHIPISGENWTVPTTMYWATLDCKLADLANLSTGLTESQGTAKNYFYDGKDWSSDMITPIQNRSVAPEMYGEWVYNWNITDSLYPSQRDSETGKLTLSDDKRTHDEFFLVLIQYPTTSAANFTINPRGAHPLFCKPAYWSAPVEATIALHADRTNITRWEKKGAQQPLQFNTTLLHNLWTYGVFGDVNVSTDDVNPLNALPVPANYLNDTQLYRGQQSAIHSKAWGGGVRLENIVSWAFARAHSDYEGLLDNHSPMMKDTLNSTLNNLFAFAMQHVLRDPDSSQNLPTINGISKVRRQSIIVDPVLSRLLEAALAILLILGCATY